MLAHFVDTFYDTSNCNHYNNWDNPLLYLPLYKPPLSIFFFFFWPTQILPNSKRSLLLQSLIL